ncbi:MAG TPA: hypothetical protein VK619_15290 [Pyrinomonadaceae bacterium]|nr:hypothetical protein [Pyrinomonadaceae bacterium]
MKLDQLKIIDVRAFYLRMALVVPVALALAGSWYATRWYVGNTMAEYVPAAEDGGIDIAREAVNLAPDDPLAHWTVASLEKSTLSPEELRLAVEHYREAVNLSPNDYRFWMDLGRAQESAGDQPGGEQSLRRAVELAPYYSFPHWYLGNLLLREGHIDDAFAELRLAGSQDTTLRPQIFNLAWHVYDHDAQSVLRAVGDSPHSRAELMGFLLGVERTDDAINVWGGLKPGERREQHVAGESLMKKLLQSKRYTDAFAIYNDYAEDGSQRAEQFHNGGFESDIEASDANPFGWQIGEAHGVQIAIDAGQPHAGGRSLRAVFNSPSLLNFDNVHQLIIVEPSTAYQLEFYVRGENLKSLATPIVEVLDAASGAGLGASAPLPLGKSDWQLVKIDFKTPQHGEAIIVRTSRAACGAEAACPIFGMVWYDDFNLQRAH